MAKMQYAQEELFEIGRENYQKLALHCQTLEVSGVWEQARRVLKQSAAQALDLYVQSILLKLAMTCGMTGDCLSFIATIPISNPLGIDSHTDADVSLTADVDKAYNMPPVLLQLCSLFDKQNADNMTEYFLDALLNIMLSMVQLGGWSNETTDVFFKEYYNKVSYYVDGKTGAAHARYLFEKLNADAIGCGVEKREARKEEVKGESKEEAKEESEEKAVSAQKDEPEEEKRESKEKGETKEKNQEKEEKKREDERKAQEEKKRKEEEKRQAARQALCAEWEKRKKAQEEADLSREAHEQFLAVKKRIEAREKAQKEAHEKRMAELLGELNALVGLSNVKKEIQSLINLIRVRKMREQMKLPEMDMSYHMVFTGNPGTGKTTVARLVAKIYKELGILSEGNLVETDRSGLVAGYVGQTAIKVHDLVEQAIGGVLFIDEAYALAGADGQNDYGAEAIDTLVKLMEDHRDNLVIIVAGYTDEMKTFLKSNTGLISRFNKFIDFPDYTKSELVSIMERMAQKAGLSMDNGAQEELTQILEHKNEEEWRDFGNARGIRNLFEKFVVNQANRLVCMEDLSDLSREELTTIKREDVAV